MSAEFKIKNGVIINNTIPITGVMSSITSDPSALVYSKAVYDANVLINSNITSLSGTVTGHTVDIASLSSVIVNGYSDTFTSGNLVSGQLTVTHNLNASPIFVTVQDNANKYVVPADIITVSDNQNILDFDSTVVAGTWKLRMAVGGIGSLPTGLYYSDSFVNGDLVSGVLTVAHNLNYQHALSVVVESNSGTMIIPDNVTYTSVNALAVDLATYGTIGGTWYVRVLPVGGMIAGGSAYTSSFTNANLVSGDLTVSHNLNSQHALVVVVEDNTTQLVEPDNITYSGLNSLVVSLSSYGAITGTWQIRVLNTGGSVGTSVSNTAWNGSNWTATDTAPSQLAVQNVLSGTVISAPVTVTSGTYNVTIADAGKLITNAGTTTTSGIVLQLDTLANFGNSFEVEVVNEATPGIGGIDANTRLMLHGNGSDDGTTFTDSSQYGLTATKNGNVVTKTGIKLLGSASIYFPANTDNLQFTYPTLGLNDFTFDFWVYLTSVSAIQRIFGIGTTDNDRVSCGVYTTGRVDFLGRAGGVGWEIYPMSPLVAINSWNHIVCMRVGTVFKLYVNGVLGGIDVQTTDVAAGGLYIGAARISSAFTGMDAGYIDEFRASSIGRTITNPPSVEYTQGYPIKIIPPSSVRLPGTSAADRPLVGSSSSCAITLRTTNTGIVSKSVYPSSTNWVDTAP